MKQKGAKVDAGNPAGARGRIYVSEKISAKILETFSGRGGDTQSPVENLSDREFEVFQLLGRGTREISLHLHISIKTVEVHRTIFARN
jgi:DNA-binding NarL/FixJ family response regulator